MPSLTGTLERGTLVKGFRNYLQSDFIKRQLRCIILAIFMFHRLGELVHIEGEDLMHLRHAPVPLHWSDFNQLLFRIYVYALIFCVLLIKHSQLKRERES
jgi:hypothetical protein